MVSNGEKLRVNSPEVEDNDKETANQSPRPSHVITARKSATSNRALHLSVYDHLGPASGAADGGGRPGSDIDQSQYRTWATAWISRLSHASLDDRIGPTKYLPSSPPKYHSRCCSTPRSTGDRAASASLGSELGQKGQGHARYQNTMTPGVLHLGRSHNTATPHSQSVDSLSGISFDSNVVRRTKSLRLVDSRILLSKYASFKYTPRATMASQQRNMTSNSSSSQRSLALTVVKSRASSAFQHSGGREEDEEEGQDQLKYSGSLSARYDRDLMTSSARDEKAYYQHKRRLTNAFISVPLATGRQENGAATYRSRIACSSRGQSRTGTVCDSPAFDNVVTNSVTPRLNLRLRLNNDSEHY